jgi:hypothetical protein
MNSEGRGEILKSALRRRFLIGFKLGLVTGTLISVISSPVNYYLLAIKYHEELSKKLGSSYDLNFLSFLVLALTTFLTLTIFEGHIFPILQTNSREKTIS